MPLWLKTFEHGRVYQIWHAEEEIMGRLYTLALREPNLRLVRLFAYFLVSCSDVGVSRTAWYLGSPH